MADGTDRRRALVAEFDIGGLKVLPSLKRGVDRGKLAPIRDLRRAFVIDPIGNGHRRPFRHLPVGRCDACIRRSTRAKNKYEKNECVFLQG